MDKMIVSKETWETIEITAIVINEDDDGHILTLECESYTQSKNLLTILIENLFIFSDGINEESQATLIINLTDLKLKKEIFLSNREVIDLFNDNKIKSLGIGFVNDNGVSDLHDTLIKICPADYGR